MVRDEIIQATGIPTYFISSWRGFDQVVRITGRFIEGLETHMIPLAIRGPFMPSNPLEMNIAEKYGVLFYYHFTGWGYVWAVANRHGISGNVYPEAMSYNRTGHAQPEWAPVIDFRDVYEAHFKSLLDEFYEEYGELESIVAIGTNPLTDYPVYGRYGGALPMFEDQTYGFNNDTLANFTRTVFFERDVNTADHKADDTTCKLYEMFSEKTVNYTTPDLADDIDAYHDTHVGYKPERGFIAYLNYENARLCNVLQEYFESLYGKTMLHKTPYEVIQGIGLENKPRYSLGGEEYWSNILDYLADKSTMEWQNMYNTRDNPFRYPTPDEELDVYLTNMPLTADRQMLAEFDWSPVTINNLTLTATMRKFGENLNRLRYYGGWYGREQSVVKALGIGAIDAGIIPQLFTSTVDLTMLSRSDRWSWEYFPNLTDYDVIITTDTGRPDISLAPVNVQEKIKSFVNDGGGLVVLRGWCDAFDEIFAGENRITDPEHPIYKPYNRVVADAYEAAYGSGIALRIPFQNRPKDTPYGADSLITPITNAMFYVSGRQDLIPAWWHTEYKSQTEGYQLWREVYYSISGKPDTPKLLWLSNRNNVSTPFEIHLNASFYNVDSKGWIAIDILDGTVVAKGVGTDITINTTIPALSWKPIYIMNTTTNL
jgi:hypothetical protein